MPVILIPNPVRPYVGGQPEVPVSGRNVGEAMECLLSQYPALRPHLTAAGGELRPFVKLFLGGTNVRDLSGPETPLREGDRLRLITSIAGG